jgi:2-polyprenyl-3-methyl-5-hydroxy-6-metoxy-1,4-benzoquinol methylase
MSFDEKTLQEKFPWQRSQYYSDYNAILGYYQVLSCLENTIGESLLDLPCGDGTLTSMFTKYFKRVVGVDASSQHLNKARQLLPQVEFHECLIENFYPDCQFDNVVMLNILEHVPDPVLTIQKASTFLKTNGRLIIHVPNENAVNRQIALHMGTLTSLGELSPFDINIAGHRRSYNLNSLQEEVKKAGLNILAFGGVFYKMLSTPQMDWLLKNGLWESGHGWGRTGKEKDKDWKLEFCRACYEFGKDRPEDCNIVYVCATKKEV